MNEEWPWLQKQPVFTTHGEKGGSVTRVPPNATLAPLWPGFILLIVGFAVSSGLTIGGFGLAFAGKAEALDPGAWWWLALGIPSGILTIFLLAGAYATGTELIMRSNPRNMIMFAGVLGGTALGFGALAVWWSWRADDIGIRPESIEYPGRNHHQLLQADIFGVGAMIAAIACLFLGVIAFRGVRRARRDVKRILRLRNSGSRHVGVVSGLPDPDRWNGGGDVPIRYRDENGNHTRRVRVNTTAGKIPVPGTRLIVFTENNDLLVEVDPNHPLEYHHDSRVYEPSTDGGGS